MALTLLHNMGHEVIGITMEIFDGSLPVKDSERHACYGPGEEEDVAAAQSVCNALGVPVHVIDLKKDKTKKAVTEGFETTRARDIPGWLSLDEENLVGTVIQLPSRDDISIMAEEQLIVEFSSK